MDIFKLIYGYDTLPQTVISASCVPTITMEDWISPLFEEEFDPEWVRRFFFSKITNFVEGCEGCEWYRDNSDTLSCCTDHEGPPGWVEDPEDWGYCRTCGRDLEEDCACYETCSCGNSRCENDGYCPDKVR
jgi:hypothetical protein